MKKPGGLESVIDNDLGAERAELQEYISVWPPSTDDREHITLKSSLTQTMRQF